MVILNLLNNIQTLLRQSLIKLYCLSLSRFKIPNSAKAHEDCRKTVCIICMKKADRELAGTQMTKIQQVIQKHINFKEHRTPLAACDNCKIQLGKLEKGQTKTIPQLFNF